MRRISSNQRSFGRSKKRASAAQSTSSRCVYVILLNCYSCWFQKIALKLRYRWHVGDWCLHNQHCGVIHETFAVSYCVFGVHRCWVSTNREWSWRMRIFGTLVFESINTSGHRWSPLPALRLSLAVYIRPVTLGGEAAVKQLWHLAWRMLVRSHPPHWSRQPRQWWPWPSRVAFS